MDLDDDELEATRKFYKRGEKVMYRMKPKFTSMIKEKRLNRKLANIVGVTEGYMSGIVTNAGRRNASKMTAYAITKAIDSDLEITDVFDIIEKNN